MRYDKVFLINPSYSGTRQRVIFCAGIGYISESLIVAGVEHDVLDMSLGYQYQDLYDRVKASDPQLIGLSVMTYRYKETYALITRIKKDFPHIYIIAGGPHMSLLREKVLKDCPALDYTAVMEGEQTVVELVQGVDLKEIPGLLYRENGAIQYNRDREFLKNLDEIPFPRYEKFELDQSFNKQINALPIVSSRGCPFECIYCPVQQSIGRMFRMRSPQSIIEELTYWYDQGYRRFSFADDNFTLLKERVYELCDLLKKSHLKDIQLNCDNGVRADRIDRDLLTVMREVGFCKLAIAVEAGNNKVLKLMKKHETIEQITQAIEVACELGFIVDLFFLVGSPGETLKDLEDSFKIALKYPVGKVNFYNIIPFPHTCLFSWIKENGTLLKDPDDYLHDYPILDIDPLFETKDMSANERRRGMKKAFGIMRKSARNSWARRLPKLGIMAKPLASLYCSWFVQNVVLRNKVTRSWVYSFAHKVLS